MTASRFGLRLGGETSNIELPTSNEACTCRSNVRRASDARHSMFDVRRFIDSEIADMHFLHFVATVHWSHYSGSDE